MVDGLIVDRLKHNEPLSGPVNFAILSVPNFNPQSAIRNPQLRDPVSGFRN
jgi:hypothetical protein